MKPNFHNMKLKSTSKEKTNIPQWEKDNRISKDWMTAEQIHVKSVYTKDDLQDIEHLNYAAGLPPFFYPWYVRSTTPCRSIAPETSH